MLVDCDDPRAIHKSCSMLPAFVFEARPVIAVEDAVSSELEVIAWRDGLKGNSLPGRVSSSSGGGVAAGSDGTVPARDSAASFRPAEQPPPPEGAVAAEPNRQSFRARAADGQGPK